MADNKQLLPVKNSALARRLGLSGDRTVRPLVVGGSTLAVLGLAGYGLVSALRDTFIVTLGISAVDSLTAATLYGVVPLGAVVLAAAGVRGLSSRLQQGKSAQARDALVGVKLSASTITPASIRTALESVAASNSALVGEVDDALTQLDEMDSKQAHLQRLIRLNEVNYAQNVVASLDEVEQYLCVNLVQVINRVIVSGEGEVAACKTRFAQVLAENRQQLDRCQQLLDDTADWVSGNSPKSSLESVQALQEVIHEQVRQLQERATA